MNDVIGRKLCMGHRVVFYSILTIKLSTALAIDSTVKKVVAQAASSLLLECSGITSHSSPVGLPVDDLLVLNREEIEACT